MSAQIRRYIREKEDWEFKRGYSADELQASTLRKDFLKRYIINFDTHLFKTQEERDWAYISKRYNTCNAVSTTTMLFLKVWDIHSLLLTSFCPGESSLTKVWSTGLSSPSL